MLDGVRVLDLTTSIAGPYATMLLSDFGAEVVKVERPGGDDARHWGPPFLDGESLWFLSVNRNKKSVRLDFSVPEGREVLAGLIDSADVLVTNLLPTAQRKFGIDAGRLRSARPDLLHVSITGFGLNGPYAARPCYDLIAEGFSSVMDLTGPSGAAPQKVGAPAADMLAGTDAALATLAALNRRAVTGEGCTIDIALAESMVRFMAPRIVPFLGSGEVPRRSGGTDSVIAIYQTFDTADLPLTLGLGNDGIWKRFWDAVEDPAGAEGEEVATNAARRANRGQIVDRIQTILRRRPRAEWLERFSKARVPAGPIYRVDEVVEDRHLLERDTFFRIDQNDRQIPQVSLGIHVDGEAAGYVAAPPRLGEHSEELLRGLLGYDCEKIQRLRTLGVI
ncbi:crotonobetainyl-CoA:carnitine CoA-transferase CaiB-like acyl-CoA transferase [Pseudochelatococcus lubricantis]|uniref:Crotonobetainyl-CoA:carnitine CoA-transferase CaiB-like acyl-CoA transferase n=1 Tax=Pseudochelatococcus lubricantis TaxID=1538102 RepID=A0ABX0UTT7_9HYPH|nr:CoA transferase [Pseudochelatococcus lubricantis]NIJ56374.1 crotonobetainyl-CoA:carnitine CoA-transferase CaiB-like acyl-CoA transferase [Pseudochelatococcus lubricantis]